MILPKRTGVGLRTVPRTARCLSTTTIRPWATPTSRPPSSTARSDNPVDDIDLVFDYPSESQGSYQKQHLDSSGLDLHSAMPHHPKQGQSIPGAGRLGKEMGTADSGNIKYIGLGAVGLGGLYMMMRRGGTKSNSNMAEPGDLAAQKSADSNMERMLGRGR
ncbi:hypothetical protein C8A00DRAFT_17355 [Chaetomidium leptoderma]|uniref:Uncharacterized protein n=1 Tax=Chaetomidium leptoderma TaxID=669021 RepID=A0AAN6ZTE1_9PEZI|nr:hypothetical protein C8A00DRAFT_17355 [Chaetomidium leptoderma]